MNSIEVKQLTKKFGKFISVNNISFDVKKGEIYGYLGANGAGKTTTIKMLCGLISPTTGDALVGGYSIKKDPENVKKHIGYMSQKFSLYNDLTVEENINFFGGVYGIYGNELKTRKEWVLKVSNLMGKEKLLTSILPGGIKQRLALCTAVIHRPEIVFLDEPTSGVDPLSRRAFWDLINDLSEQGITIFVTTHYLEEAEFCNNIALMNAGKIIANGTSKELKTEHIKAKMYSIECDEVINLYETLHNERWIEDISLFGNNLHLSVPDTSITTDVIKSKLENEMHFRINRIAKIVPTLEDVFIHLLEKDEKTNAK